MIAIHSGGRAGDGTVVLWYRCGEERGGSPGLRDEVTQPRGVEYYITGSLTLLLVEYTAQSN